MNIWNVLTVIRRKYVAFILTNGVNYAVPTNQVCILHARKKAAYNATSQQDVLSKLEMIVKIYYEIRKKTFLVNFVNILFKEHVAF